MQETQVQSLGRGDPLEEKMVTYSSILAWRIPRTEDPGGLWSMGSQRVRHDWTHACTVLILATSLEAWNCVPKSQYKQHVNKKDRKGGRFQETSIFLHFKKYEVMRCKWRFWRDSRYLSISFSHFWKSHKDPRWEEGAGCGAHWTESFPHPPETWRPRPQGRLLWVSPSSLGTSSSRKKNNYPRSLFPALIPVYNYTFISVITWLICFHRWTVSPTGIPFDSLLYARPKCHWMNSSNRKTDGAVTRAWRSSRALQGWLRRSLHGVSSRQARTRTCGSWASEGEQAVPALKGGPGSTPDSRGPAPHSRPQPSIAAAATRRGRTCPALHQDPQHHAGSGRKERRRIPVGPSCS